MLAAANWVGQYWEVSEGVSGRLEVTGLQSGWGVWHMVLSQEQLDVVDDIDETFFRLFKLQSAFVSCARLMESRTESWDQCVLILDDLAQRMKLLIGDRPDLSVLLRDSTLTGMEPRLGGGKT